MNHEEELDRTHARLHRMSCENGELRKRRDDLLRANNEEVERRRAAERERDELRHRWESALAAASAAAGHEIGLWPMGAVVKVHLLEKAIKQFLSSSAPADRGYLFLEKDVDELSAIIRGVE